MKTRALHEVRVGITVSLPGDLVKQLNAYCLQFHISRSQVAEVSVRRFLLAEQSKAVTPEAAQ